MPLFLVARWSCILLAVPAAAGAQERGLFEAAVDVGKVHAPGTAAFDAARGQYRLTGGGENMWESTDAFHFLYRKSRVTSP